VISDTISCLIDNSDKLGCLVPYAYEPAWIYFFLILMMLLSSVGLPLPEEVTLVSVGILAYMGSHPDKYPPPYAGAEGVNAQTAALVAFFAVVFSDFLIYSIGRFFGARVFNWGPIRRVISEEAQSKIYRWTDKYGALACGIFRFTPGIRFPGHLACGIVKFPAWKFLAVDSFAALISVPTQILLLAYYGDHVLGALQKFKYVLLVLLAVGGVYYVIRKYRSGSGKVGSRSL
jgi:membrane protein DedA with SNARE-associated domain